MTSSWAISGGDRKWPWRSPASCQSLGIFDITAVTWLEAGVLGPRGAGFPRCSVRWVLGSIGVRCSVTAMPGPAASIAVILLLQLRIRESAEDVTVVCRDLRDVEVTWDPAEHAGANLSLTWRYTPEPLRPCPRYFLSDGLTSRCVLPVRNGRPLEIDVRRGAEPVFHRKGLASAFLKPRPPDQVTLHWLEDAIRVTCRALPHVGLDYIIQHRGIGDTDWVASAPAPSCNVTVGGVDPSACLAFRVRVLPRESFYGGEVQPSDWSPVTQWRAGDAMGAGNGSCQALPYSGFPKLQVACGLVTLLTSLLLLLSLWRVKRGLLPWVPDPRGGFRGLFERHGGNFQAWIAQDVSPTPKPEAIDSTDPAEVALVLEHHGKGVAPDPALGSPGLSCQGPRDRDVVRVGGATFVMDGGSYMTL